MIVEAGIGTFLGAQGDINLAVGAGRKGKVIEPDLDSQGRPLAEPTS